MAGTALTAVTDTELQIPFAAQYTSAELNEKMRSFPRGINRGFKIQAGGNNDEIELVVDGLSGDSVMQAVGILATAAFALTYRTTSTVTLDLSGLASARFYVAFVPNYVIGSTTDGEWRAYTEAEFEAGDIETDGGVFLCAAITSGNSNPFPERNLLIAGRSTTTAKLFMREDDEDFRKDRGSRYKRKVWEYIPTPLDEDIESTVTWDSTDYIVGNGSLQYAVDVSLTDPFKFEEVLPVWMNPAASERPKVIIQFWYKTDATFDGSTEAVTVNLVFFDEDGALVATASDENGAGRCPTFFQVSASNTSWTLVRYECQVPDPSDYGGQRTAFVQPDMKGQVDAGVFFLGGIQIFVEGEESTEVGFDEFAPQKVHSLDVRKIRLLSQGPGLDRSFWQLEVDSLAGFQLQPRVRDSYAGSFTISMGDSSLANTQIITFFGDSGGTGTSYFETDGASIRSNTYMRTPELRTAAAGSGAQIVVRDNAGVDQVGINVEKIEQSDNFSYNSGSSGGLGGDTPDAHTLYAGNQVKAWGLYEADGIGGYALIKGFNIDDVGNVSGSGFVNFLNSMTDDDYAVVITNDIDPDDAGTLTDLHGTVNSRTTGGFATNWYDISADSSVSVATTPVVFSFIVLGEQS